jgi:hypothetical protein
MEYDYKVEVYDYIKGLTIIRETFNDANSAYNVYRQMEDEYRDSETIEVHLTEPE